MKQPTRLVGLKSRVLEKRLPKDSSRTLNLKLYAMQKLIFSPLINCLTAKATFESQDKKEGMEKIT